MFNHNFYSFNDEILVDCVSIKRPDLQSKILAMDFFKNTKILKIFNKDDTFRPFGGYKFFSPEDRTFLHSDHIINNPVQAFNLLKKSYM